MVPNLNLIKKGLALITVQLKKGLLVLVVVILGTKKSITSIFWIQELGTVYSDHH